MLPNGMNSSATSNFLEVTDRVHFIYTLRLPPYMLSISIGTSSSFMLTTTVISDTDAEYNTSHHSVLVLGWQRYMCVDYEIALVEDVNGNLLQISSTVILRIKIGSAIYMSFLLVAENFSVEKLIGTQLMNCKASYIVCIDQQTEFTNSKVPLLECASNDLTVKGLE